MKTRLVLLLLLVSMTVSAQWTEQMYTLYTYDNYTEYAAFNEPVKPENLDIALLEAEYTHLGAGVAFYFERTWLMVKATQNFLAKRK